MISRMNDFTSFVERKFGNESINGTDTDDVLEGSKNIDDVIYDETYEGYHDEEIEPSLIDVDDVEDLELFMNAEVILPNNVEGMQTARVIGRSEDDNGRKIGKYHPNPILNSQIYDVMFSDGAVKQYAANMIAENIYSQVDEEGHRYQLLRNIISHKKDETAVCRQDGWIVSKNGNRVRRHTTKGWYFEVEWADGTTSWVPLKELKHNNLVELAEYCQVNDLLGEPAVAWWADHVLKKTKQIIAKVKSRAKERTIKYTIKIPRSVKKAYELD